MKTGDLVFHKGRVVAKAARSIPIPKGEEFRFMWPMRLRATLELVEPLGDVPGHTASIRRLFDLGGVAIWELVIPEDADRDVFWDQINMFKPYDTEPSASSAGMVTAIDLVMSELGDRYPMLCHTLVAMRAYFADRAAREKVAL